MGEVTHPVLLPAPFDSHCEKCGMICSVNTFM